VHFTPPYALHVAPPKEGLRNDLLPIWLKSLKMIASFTTRAMVKTTLETSITCCVKLAKMNLMTQESLKSEPIYGRYGMLKIING
jgi:hypothetical protein